MDPSSGYQHLIQIQAALSTQEQQRSRTGQQQRTTVAVANPVANVAVDQYWERIVYEAACSRGQYYRDIWLNDLLLLLVPVIGWIVVVVTFPLVYVIAKRAVNSWYLYLTDYHLNYSGFGDTSVGATWGTRTRRIALVDIESIEANQRVGYDYWPPCESTIYCPSSINTVVVWLKAEKQTAYNFSSRTDRVEIRYIQNAEKFVAAVQKQMNALP